MFYSFIILIIHSFHVRKFFPPNIAFTFCHLGFERKIKDFECVCRARERERNACFSNMKQLFLFAYFESLSDQCFAYISTIFLFAKRANKKGGGWRGFLELLIRVLRSCFCFKSGYSLRTVCCYWSLKCFFRMMMCIIFFFTSTVAL